MKNLVKEYVETVRNTTKMKDIVKVSYIKHYDNKYKIVMLSSKSLKSYNIILEDNEKNKNIINEIKEIYFTKKEVFVNIECSGNIFNKFNLFPQSIFAKRFAIV